MTRSRIWIAGVTEPGGRTEMARREELCASCNVVAPVSSMHESKIDGMLYCWNCADQKTMCPGCGSQTLVNPLYTWRGQFWCRRCYEEVTGEPVTLWQFIKMLFGRG